MGTGERKTEQNEKRQKGRKRKWDKRNKKKVREFNSVYCEVIRVLDCLDCTVFAWGKGFLTMISMGVSHVDVAGARAGAPHTEGARLLTRIHLPASTCAADRDMARDARPRRPAHGRLDLTRAVHARIEGHACENRGV